MAPQPADFVGRAVATWVNDDAGSTFSLISQGPANVLATPLDPKTGQIRVIPAGAPGGAPAFAPSAPFTNVMALRTYASFADGPALCSAVLGSPGVLQKLRDLNETSRDAAASKTVVMAGEDFRIHKFSAVENQVTLRPVLGSAPIGGYTGLERVVDMLGMPALRVVHVQGREPPPPAPAPPTSVAAPQKIEVELTKNTFLSKSGDSSWRYDVFRGVVPDATDKVAIKVMQKAGLKQLPKDASFTNYMVAQDLNFVPLAFHRMSGNGEAVSAGHQCAMEVLYAKYLQQEREAPGYLAGKERDKDKKEDPPHPVVHDMVKGVKTCVKTICHLLTLPESKEVEALIDDQVDLGHDILGRLMRRVKWVVDHPSVENCRTPVWFYRQQNKKRVREDEEKN